MWKVDNQNLAISMAEGDYGVALPIVIKGADMGEGDAVLFTIKDRSNGDTVLSKTITTIVSNTANLQLTSADTALLEIGTYLYSLDWYHNEQFMCNVVPRATFRVVDKA